MSIALTGVWLTNVAFLIHGACLFAADFLQRFDPPIALRNDTCAWILSLHQTSD